MLTRLLFCVDLRTLFQVNLGTFSLYFDLYKSRKFSWMDARVLALADPCARLFILADTIGDDLFNFWMNRPVCGPHLHLQNEWHSLTEDLNRQTWHGSDVYRWYLRGRVGVCVRVYVADMFSTYLLDWVCYFK